MLARGENIWKSNSIFERKLPLGYLRKRNEKGGGGDISHKDWIQPGWLWLVPDSPTEAYTQSYQTCETTRWDAAYGLHVIY